MNTGPLDFLPLWALCLATIAVGFLAVEAGYWLGILRRRRLEPEKESSVGVMAAATLGLLAFTLAFTFALAAGWFDVRQQFIIDEANAIRTSYLRSVFLSEPQRSTIRGILRQYLEARLNAAQPDKVELVASQHLHARLWAEAVAAVQNQPSSVLVGLFIESLNDVIAMHAKRATLRSRISWGHLGNTLFGGESRHGGYRLPRGTDQSAEVSSPSDRSSHVLCGYLSHRRSRPTSGRSV
jgi:hypothetical protein